MSDENMTPEFNLDSIQSSTLNKDELEKIASQVTPVDLEEPVITDEPVVNNPVITDNNEQNKQVENKPTEGNTNKKYQIKYSFSTKCEWKNENVILSMPSNTVDEIKTVLESMPNIDVNTNEEENEWVETIRDSASNLTYDKQYESTVNNPNSNFSQELDYRGNALNISRIKTNFKSDKLTGERAIIAFNKSLGLGDLIHVPLFHSGFYITLKTPSEIDMIRLNREIIEDKIQAGRATQGLAFSNMMSYTLNRIAKFVIDHIYDTTLQASVLEKKELFELIKCQDFNILVWGILVSMYPQGVQYKRACLSDPEKCDYVLKENLNLFKLMWTNISALSENHLAHMSNKIHKTMSLESVMNYQNTLPAISEKVITIDTLKFKLVSPNFLEYVNSGEKWISNIVAMVDEIVTNNKDERTKNALIEQKSQATRLRQIAHWVKEIEFDEKVVDDTETIEQILDILSQDDEKSTKLFEEVSKYIDESTISLIGIPNYICPKCGEQQQEDNGTIFGNIIPLDVVSIFFDQHLQRMQKIASR